MSNFRLTAEEIKANWDKFLGRIEKAFKNHPDRKDKMLKMYNDLEEDIIFLPASTYEHFHNAIPGGYIDHVNRVVDFSMQYHVLYNNLGLDVSNFTLQELVFSAINHDLGKVGFPGHSGAIPETNDWWKTNKGRMYQPNTDVPYARVQDKSLYILQRYGIECSWNEYQAILIHDGLYDEGNKSYYVSFKSESKLRVNLPMLLHQADMAASRFEWERWNRYANKIVMQRVDTPIEEEPKQQQTQETKKEENPFGNFGEVFND